DPGMRTALTLDRGVAERLRAEMRRSQLPRPRRQQRVAGASGRSEVVGVSSSTGWKREIAGRAAHGRGKMSGCALFDAHESGEYRLRVCWADCERVVVRGGVRSRPLSPGGC